MSDAGHPPAYPHGEIRELFPDVFFVSGSARMPGPLPIRFSRNMVILRQEDKLTLVHSMRLDEAGLARLDELGKVEHVIRLAGFHGMDDPFYKARYDAKVWAVDGHVYAKGFDNPKTKPEDGYFQPDAYMTPETELPIAGAKLVAFDCKGGEGVLLIPNEGGILLTGDALQNWHREDPHFSGLGMLTMRMMGFIKPHNVGPGWLKMAQPNLSQVKALLDLPFEHVLPVHGDPVRGNAREKYRPRIEKLG